MTSTRQPGYPMINIPETRLTRGNRWKARLKCYGSACDARCNIDVDHHIVAYSKQLSQLLRTNPPNSDVSDIQWQHVANSMTTVGMTVLGYEKPHSDKPWKDEECHEMSEEKDAAYRACCLLIVPEGSISDETTPIIDYGVDCPPQPNQNEISPAIERLKNNKAAGVRDR